MVNPIMADVSESGNIDSTDEAVAELRRRVDDAIRERDALARELD
jgi:hypothetical protein